MIQILIVLDKKFFSANLTNGFVIEATFHLQTNLLFNILVKYFVALKMVGFF